MPDPNEIAAAAERLRRDKAGEDVYDAYDELLDYPDGEGQGTRWEVDCAILADAYLDEHADELLTLAERIAADLFTDGQGRRAKRLVMDYEGDAGGTGWGEGPVVDRILSVIREQEG